ncbi:ElaB/YqjD/DUF883 family membrane-anchored ribosome-binding protein [Sphingomonas zeicaulis]|uniref:hypothetical protein n=1 Tax=Sphingomonas zeicaulis TaxID=1632740 RepID=UPI003D1C700B
MTDERAEFNGAPEAVTTDPTNGATHRSAEAVKAAAEKVSAAAKPAVDATRAAARDAGEKVRAEASKLRGQATDKAREVATDGKEKASSALDEVAKLISEAAGTVDERLGAQYGGYARSAADMVSGVASQLRDKDVDELFEDARSFVKKSPAVAIGTAAALGFVLARLVKAGLGDAPVAEESPFTPPTPVTPEPAASGFADTPPSVPPVV